MLIDWNSYNIGAGYDELIQSQGLPRSAAEPLCRYLSSLGRSELQERKNAADLAILTMGITFTVYTEGGSIDRTWPFDIIPRIISRHEWIRTEMGLKQRVTALNLFIDDLYHEQRIVKDGVFPAELLANSTNSAWVSTRPMGYGPISAAPIWCATRMASYMYWRIIYASPRGCRICWK